MRAAVYHGPGDVRVESVPDPRDPGPDELLLQVTRASICGTDASEYASGPHLIPRDARVILGHEFTGTVLAAGSAVEGVATGSRVVAGAGMWCGQCPPCRAGRTNLCRSYYTLGLQADGGLAEYVLAPSKMCEVVPDGCSDDAAALAQPLAVALHAVRRGAIAAGEPAVIVGVGGIGAFLVAAAKARGASPLIAADVRDRRLETARRLGADVVVDARSEDLLTAVREATGGEGAAVFVEASGRDGALATAAACTRRGGRVVMLGLPTTPQLLDVARISLAEIDLVATLAHVCKDDLPEAVAMLAAGNLHDIVLDRTVPLEAVVAEGLAPLAAGALDGKVLVAPAG
jgi:threonine dehydrogenase-like Zn-dependent dehydrogenase